MVIGISGKAGSGKDVIAGRLRECWGYTVLPFAAPLKEEVLSRLYRTLEAIHAHEGHELAQCSYANRPECIRDMVYNRKPPIVRALLQEWGTELRRAECETYWTDRWRERATGSVVAPDVRFPNEAEAIAAAGGILWRVVRPGTVRGEHDSETVMDGWRWYDAVIQNVGSLADLQTEVDRLMVERGAVRKPAHFSDVQDKPSSTLHGHADIPDIEGAAV